MNNLRDVLTALAPQIPKSLLSGNGMTRLVKRVGDLPGAVATTCGFELRLGDIDPAADFALSVLPGAISQYYIEAATSGNNPQACDVWLSRFLTGQTRDRWVNSVVLAYDIIACTETCPRDPIVYLKAHPDPVSLGFAANDVEQIADTLDSIAQWERSEPLRLVLNRVAHKLPAGARIVITAAITPARQLKHKVARLAIWGISLTQLESFLSEIHWCGDIRNVVQNITELNDVANKFLLVLDVTPNGVAPQLGFEMFSSTYTGSSAVDLLLSWEATTSADWRAFIRRLVDINLCRLEKAEGLLTWPGCQVLFGEKDVLRLYVGINHVKISFGKGNTPEAKAYVGIKLIPFNSRSL